MNEIDELQMLRSDLEDCLRRADQLKLSMAGIYISHALEHVDYVKAKKPAPPVLRSVTGGKTDD